MAALMTRLLEAQYSGLQVSGSHRGAGRGVCRDRRLNLVDAGRDDAGARGGRIRPMPVSYPLAGLCMRLGAGAWEVAR
jgi:hypothetical protein